MSCANSSLQIWKSRHRPPSVKTQARASISGRLMSELENEKSFSFSRVKLNWNYWIRKTSEIQLTSELEKSSTTHSNSLPNVHSRRKRFEVSAIEWQWKCGVTDLAWIASDWSRTKFEQRSQLWRRFTFDEIEANLRVATKNNRARTFKTCSFPSFQRRVWKFKFDQLRELQRYTARKSSKSKSNI